MKGQALLDKYCEKEPIAITIIYRRKNNNSNVQNGSSAQKKINMNILFVENNRTNPLNLYEYNDLLLDSEEELVKRIIIDYLNEKGNIIKVKIHNQLSRNPDKKAIEIVKDNKKSLILGSNDIQKDFAFVFKELSRKRKTSFYNYAVSLIDNNMVNNILITTNISNVTSIKYWEGNDEYLVEYLKDRHPKRELEYKVAKNITANTSTVEENDIECIIKILTYYIQKYKASLLHTSLKENECIYSFYHGDIKIKDNYIIKNTMSCYILANNLIGEKINKKQINPQQDMNKYQRKRRVRKI